MSKGTEKEIMGYLGQQQDSMNAMQSQIQNSQTVQMQQERFLEEQERSMVREQLDLSEELETMEHLLRGHAWNAEKMAWDAPTSPELEVFTEYGIQYILWFARWYLNKNTLLSNYDDETILQKMEDLSTTFTDDIFMEYDKMFKYPGFEECRDELNKRIKHKIEVRKYALELMGKEVDEEKIRNEFLKEMESRIEEELTKIREQKMKNKLKRFESIVRVVQDMIHSAYQRSWKGQERGTLRKHTHVSETIGGQMPNVNNQGRFSWLSGRNR